MKLIIKITLLIFFINTISFAEAIKEFKITGNKRISDSTIILFSKVKINDDINKDDLNEIIKELYSTNFFKNVKVSFDNQIIEIFVAIFLQYLFPYPLFSGCHYPSVLRDQTL